MPIKNLTERRRLPRIGKIHLGIMADKDKNGKPCHPYPKAVDYFVFPADHPQHDELVAVFGEKPRELRIVFPLEDEERFASQFYRCYSKTRGLICKGDGETALRMVDTQTGALADRDSKAVAMKEVPCQGRECPDYKTKCKELMNLQFILPEISGLGIWQIDTSSINSIRNINGSLDLIRAVYGRVRMVPLILSMEQIEVVNPDDGKKKNVWVLNLRSTDKMVEAAMKARMEPLELVAGMAEGEVLDDVDVLPTPDDERPPLVTPDWEGHTGESIKEPMSPEEAQELAEHIWPEEKTEEAFPDDGKDLDQRTKTTEAIKQQSEPTAEAKLDFDPDMLLDSLKQVKWKDVTVKSYLKNVYRVNTEGTVVEVVARLTREQGEAFFKEIQDRLEMV